MKIKTEYYFTEFGSKSDGSDNKIIGGFNRDEVHEMHSEYMGDHGRYWQQCMSPQVNSQTYIDMGGKAYWGDNLLSFTEKTYKDFERALGLVYDICRKHDLLENFIDFNKLATKIVKQIYWALDHEVEPNIIYFLLEDNWRKSVYTRVNYSDRIFPFLDVMDVNGISMNNLDEMVFYRAYIGHNYIEKVQIELSVKSKVVDYYEEFSNVTN
jgi:hypothetical protein